MKLLGKLAAVFITSVVESEVAHSGDETFPVLVVFVHVVTGHCIFAILQTVFLLNFLDS